MNKKLNILRAGDQNFWAYYWISQEHSRYTSHNMKYAKYDEVNLKDIDVLYIHSPDITNFHAEKLPVLAKEKGIKVIGAYAGNSLYWSPAEKRTYSYADIIVAISPQTYSFAKFHYTNIPVIYMPECVDTNFFKPKEFRYNSFKIGWAGGVLKKIKRFELTKQLNYPIIVKDNWEKQRQSKDKNLTLAEMRDFYNSIDVLICTSESECQPRVVMEAMSCGIPVIATDVGSMKMLLDNFQLVDVDPKLCVEQMNEKLRILAKYPEFRQELGIQNRLYINQYFSWKSQKNLWDNLFTNVYNNQINKSILETEQFLTQFGTNFTSKLLSFDNQSEIILDYNSCIKELIDSPYSSQFWFTRHTCKDMVFNKPLTDDGILQIGVTNDNIKQELINIGKKYNITIEITDKNSKQTTKFIQFNNFYVRVPIPVKEYLLRTFNKSYDTLLKENSNE